MSQVRFRKVARLESLAHAYLRKKREADSQFWEFMRNNALTCVANLSALVLYGSPKTDESLRLAWRRCLASAAWQARRERHGGWDEYGRDDCGSPFDFGARRVSEYFRKYFLPDLPGADEIDKFSMIFARAPPWLLWFTYGDVEARILGIKVPDLSPVNRYRREKKRTFDELPEGPFEYHLLPDGTVDPFEVCNKNSKFEDALKGMTPRERKRMLRIYETYKT